MPFVAIDRVDGLPHQIRVVDFNGSERVVIQGPGVAYGLSRGEVERGLQRTFGERAFWVTRFEIVEVPLVPASAVRYEPETQ